MQIMESTLGLIDLPTTWEVSLLEQISFLNLHAFHSLLGLYFRSETIKAYAVSFKCN